MVNYCCVSGCGRNNKTSKHLFYYGLPKEHSRLERWLNAIGREDLLKKNLKKLSYRVCSRHFSPSDIKNKHLCDDAVPTQCLPSTEDQDEEEKQMVHEEIICNSCNKPIVGFRYKCITCPDFDLCSKCEMLEVHSDHYLLRIPKPVNYKVADAFIKKWQSSVNVKIEHVAVNELKPEGSSDDELPITMYSKKYDNVIDISEDIKAKIRDEVTRVLNIKHIEPMKRKRDSRKNLSNKKKKNECIGDEVCGLEHLDTLNPAVQEVVFADVNNLRNVQYLDIKNEINAGLTSNLKEREQVMTDLISETDFILSIN